MDGAAPLRGLKTQCPVCYKWFKPASLRRHWSHSAGCRPLVSHPNVPPPFDSIVVPQVVVQAAHQASQLSTDQLHLEDYPSNVNPPEHFPPLDSDQDQESVDGAVDLDDNSSRLIADEEAGLLVYSDDENCSDSSLSSVPVEAPDDDNDTADAVLNANLNNNNDCVDSRGNGILPIVESPILHFPLTDQRFLRVWEPRDRLLLRLSNLLDDTGTPRRVLDQVLKIIAEEHAQGILQLCQTTGLSRKSFFSRLGKRFPCPAPRSTIVSLEGASTADINYQRSRWQEVELMHFDFFEQVQDLLNCPSLFGDMNNLKGCVNIDTPFERYIPPEGAGIDEVHDAKWYQSTCDYIENHVCPNESFLVMAVIMYIDKTGTDIYQRWPLEPLLFTLSILNRACRNKADSWRPLAYIPDPNKKSSAEKKVSKGTDASKGRNTRNYHKLLRLAMKSFIDNQGLEKPIYLHVRMGDNVKRLRVFFPFAFFMGDALSNDALCGRLQSYSGQGRISRFCNCPANGCSDTTQFCELIKTTTAVEINASSREFLKLGGFIQIEDRESLPTDQRQVKKRMKDLFSYVDSWNQHVHDSAFAGVWMGTDEPPNIFLRTPTDLMHAFLLGVVPYLIRIYMAAMTDSEKAAIDRLVDKLFVGQRSSERKNFPRCNFVRGITNLKLVTADEWAGVVFTLALLCMSVPGRAALSKHLHRKFPNYDSDKDDDYGQHVAEARAVASQQEQENNTKRKVIEEDEELFSGKPCSPTHILHICEQLLSFHAWYKCGAPHSKSILSIPPDGNDQSTVLGDAVRTMIAFATSRLPRHKGNGWDLQKVHELFHLDYFMDQFGSPLNWDASTGERNLKEKAKKHAATAQNRGDGEHLRQIAMREYETSVRKKAMRFLNLNVPTEANGSKDNTSQGGGERPVVACGKVKYTISPEYHERDGCRVVGKWISKRATRGQREIHPVVLHYFYDDMQRTRYPAGSTIECYTRVMIGDVSYRSHPNYNSEGPWYDWSMVNFETEITPQNNLQQPVQKRQRRNHSSNDDDSVTSETSCFESSWYPSKIVCFYRDPLADRDENLFALVHSCIDTDHNQDSVLFQRWQKEYTVDHHLTGLHQRRGGEGSVLRSSIRKVPVEALALPVFVVEDTPGLREVFYDNTEFNGITVVKPRASHWPEKFL